MALVDSNLFFVFDYHEGANAMKDVAYIAQAKVFKIKARLFCGIACSVGMKHQEQLFCCLSSMERAFSIFITQCPR